MTLKRWRIRASPGHPEEWVTVDYPPAELKLQEALAAEYRRTRSPVTLNEIDTMHETLALLGARLVPEPALEPVHEQPPLFDLEEGERRKKAGVRRALSSDRGSTWAMRADSWLYRYPHNVDLTSDDLVAAVGLPLPDADEDKNNSIGGWFSTRSQAGRIVTDGRRVQSKRPESHGRLIQVWRKP